MGLEKERNNKKEWSPLMHYLRILEYWEKFMDPVTREKEELYDDPDDVCSALLSAHHELSEEDQLRYPLPEW